MPTDSTDIVERDGVTEQGHTYRDRWCDHCKCLHRYFTGFAPVNGVARTPDIAREAAQAVWDRFWGDFQSEYWTVDDIAAIIRPHLEPTDKDQHHA